MNRPTVLNALNSSTLDDLRRAVTAAGYTVPEEIAPTPEAQDRERADRARENRRLRLRFVVGALLSAPVLSTLLLLQQWATLIRQRRRPWRLRWSRLRRGVWIDRQCH